MSVPRWIEIQAEISHLLWWAGEMDKQRAQRTPLDVMIDKASGRIEKEDAEMAEQMEALVAEYNALMAGAARWQHLSARNRHSSGMS